MTDPILKREYVTEMSEMPCHLIDGPHEWRNEISTVPN